MEKKIGQLIKERVKSQNVNVTEFAKNIGMERTNVYDIYERESIDTGLLKKIGHELLQVAYRQAKAHERNKINIGIVEENTVLRKWYENAGFVHIGTEKFDFFPFTCGYMVKELNH